MTSNKPREETDLDYGLTVGSRWFAFGHHWEIIALSKRDGEPAVVTKCLTGKSTATVISRLFARHAVPSGIEA